MNIRRRVAAITAALAMVIAGVTSAAADPVQDYVVSANPADFTPAVMDGTVLAIAQVQDRIILGGDFTTVRDPGSTTDINRPYVVAFNKTTGLIDPGFAPMVNGPVQALAVDSAGTVYAAGNFTQWSGWATRVARISASTGQPDTAFRVPNTTTGVIEDLVVNNDRLFLAGHFTSVGSTPRTALAELNRTTGAALPSLAVPISGTHAGPETMVAKIAVTPDGTRMVIIGNFAAVGGQSRVEIAVLDLSGPQVSVLAWATDAFRPTCSPVFESYTRDVAIDPEGEYLVVATTGGPGSGPPTLCDTVSRFELDPTGPGQRPTWAAYTGGDSTYSVAVTESAVYSGGHFRYQNNPFGVNTAGSGAVAREGVAALDPANGLPLRWNPGRTRGYGVRDLLVTSQGLWMGSDTDWVGGERRPRIALFPAATSGSVPHPEVASLPADVYQLRPAGVADPRVVKRYNLDGQQAGPPVPVPGGPDLTSARAATLIDGRLYIAWADGRLDRRSFDGTTFGDPASVNLNSLTPFVYDLQAMTSLFYEDGYLYFTKEGYSGLYRRGFTLDGDTVGALVTTAAGPGSGIDFAVMRDAFLAGRWLFWVHADTGALMRTRWSDHAPVAGTTTVVSATMDWRAAGLVAAGQADNITPVARAQVSCDGLTCQFDSSSGDPDGRVVATSWDFGDGQTSTMDDPVHGYAAAGRYLATLTVTDDRGAVDATTVEVVVADAGTSIQFVGARSDTDPTSSRRHRVVMPAEVQVGDTLLLTLPYNSASANAVAPPGWTPVVSGRGSSMSMAVWTRQATATDLGAMVTVTTSTYVKGQLGLVAYRGTSTLAPVVAGTLTAETTVRPDHTTPSLSAPAGAWVVSIWADRSLTTSWTLPAGPQQRLLQVSPGPAQVSAVLADSGSGVVGGVQPGLTATSAVSTRNAMTGTIVLAPAG